MTARIVTALTLAAAAFLATTKASPKTSHKASQSPSPRAVYESYGCVACHGDSGKGSCDLRQANAHFPTDDALRTFIDDPAAAHPGSKMPAYRNVISDCDYPALIAHVRRLSREAR
jgi:cytochrome c553